MICPEQLPVMNRAVPLQMEASTAGSCRVHVYVHTQSLSTTAIPAAFQSVTNSVLRVLSKPMLEILWAECKVSSNEHTYFGALCSFFNCFPP